MLNIYLVPDQHIGHLLKRDLLMSYIDFAQKFLGACGVNPKVATIPVRVSLSINQAYLNLFYLKPESSNRHYCVCKTCMYSVN